MNFLSFTPDFNSNTYTDRDVLSAFRPSNEKNTQIQQGMSPIEISEIVSDNLMAVIKEQFETTKIKFNEKAK